jgi:maltooligosyltrehalose synthase
LGSDNRRSVDYGARSGLLEQLSELLGRNRQTAILDLLEDWRDGRIKLAVIAILLAYRRTRPELFAEGGYKPPIATGPRAGQKIIMSVFAPSAAACLANLMLDPSVSTTSVARRPGTHAWRIREASEIATITAVTHWRMFRAAEQASGETQSGWRCLGH